MLLNIFNNMHQQAAAVYEHPEGLAVALYNPGKPLWIWFNENLPGADISRFFCAFLQEYPMPEAGLIFNTDAGFICANMTNKKYKMRALSVYYLSRLRPLFGIPGFSRSAVPEDAEVINTWITQFYTEALSSSSPSMQSSPQARETEAGRLFIWQNNAPSAMGMLCKQVGGLCRLNLIYTPAGLRGRGYGKAIVSDLSRKALKKDALPFLFTHANNEPANRLYLSMGFKKVGMLTELIFC